MTCRQTSTMSIWRRPYPARRASARPMAKKPGAKVTLRGMYSPPAPPPQKKVVLRGSYSPPPPPPREEGRVGGRCVAHRLLQPKQGDVPVPA